MCFYNRVLAKTFHFRVVFGAAKPLATHKKRVLEGIRPPNVPQTR